MSSPEARALAEAALAVTREQAGYLRELRAAVLRGDIDSVIKWARVVSGLDDPQETKAEAAEGRGVSEEPTSEVEKLLGMDSENAPETLRAFRVFDAGLPEALDAAAGLITTFQRTYSQNAIHDADQQTTNRVANELGVSGEELSNLMASPPVSDPARAQAIAEARAAISNSIGRMVRGQLFLLANRSYMFAVTDLLRLRLSPAEGYQRTEAEASGLACLMRTEPEIARQWWDIQSDREGRAFYRRHQKALHEVLGRHGLTLTYELASGVIHARLMSIVRGLTLNVFETGGRQFQEMRMAFQEADGDSTHLAIMCGLSLLRTQQRVFAAFSEALPEASDEILRQQRLPRFGLEIDRLWSRFTKTYPEVAERARRSSAGQGEPSKGTAE